MEQTKKSRSALVGWLVCGLGALFYCYEYLLRIEPSVMMPQLMQQFHVTAESLGVLIAMYYTAYTPMQLFVGVLTDVFGPRKILTIAISICVIGSFVFGATDSAFVAGAGRLLIGFGSAFAFVGVLKLGTVWLPANRFALFSGIATALGMVGAMVGDVELTLLAHTAGWKQTIFIWLVVRDMPAQTNKPDLKYTFSFSAVLKDLFAIARNPQMWINGLIGCMLYLSLSAFAEVWGIQFLRHVFHLSDDTASRINSMVFFGWLVGAPLVGIISDRLRTRKLPLVFGCLLALVTILIILLVPTLTPHALYVLFFLFGLFASSEIVCFAIGTEYYPKKIAGMAIAFTNMIIMFSGMVLQPLVGKLLDMRWQGVMAHGIRVYSASDYRYALMVLPIGMGLGFVLSLFLKESYGRKTLAQE